MKDSSPKLNSIDWCASAQGFSSRPAFFENAKRLQTTPDQEILLPVRETYLIVVQEVCTNALLKESAAKLNSIDWFASGQGLCVLLVLGSGFLTVFACLLLLIETNPLMPLLKIKLEPKSLAWPRLGEICALIAAKQKLRGCADGILVIS